MSAFGIWQLRFHQSLREVRCGSNRNVVGKAKCLSESTQDLAPYNLCLANSHLTVIILPFQNLLRASLEIEGRSDVCAPVLFQQQ